MLSPSTCVMVNSCYICKLAFLMDLHGIQFKQSLKISTLLLSNVSNVAIVISLKFCGEYEHITTIVPSLQCG
jgi:hypothetical protein